MEDNKDLRCPNCGATITGNASHCEFCGSPLTGLSEYGIADDNAVTEDEILQYFENILHQHYELKAENPNKEVFTEFTIQDIHEQNGLFLDPLIESDGNNILILDLEEKLFAKLKCLQLNFSDIVENRFDVDECEIVVKISLGDDYMEAAKIVYDVFKVLSFLNYEVLYSTCLGNLYGRFKYVYSTANPYMIGEYNKSWSENLNETLEPIMILVGIILGIAGLIFYFVVSCS